MFDTIVKECQYVVDNAKDVSIDYSKFDLLIRELNSFQNKHYFESSPFDIMKLTTEEIINFLIIYDSIDFSFWGDPKWTISTEDGQMDGGMALLYALLKYFKEHRENFFYDLNSLSREEFSNILKGNVEIPLFNERYNIIRTNAKIIIEKMDGNFYKYIKNVNNDTALFNIIINNFNSFEDKRTYQNHTIPFYKLVQLLTSDILHILKIKENKNINYSNLVGCADYKIPQAMRDLGLLVYSDKLSNIIDSKTVIEENSSYEVEIRASQIIIINEIWKKTGGMIDRIDINDFIWLKGQGKAHKPKPYHLTRTCSY